ncbi:MAG: hypothetical protein GX937_11555 [Lentisphaerae bacterium]|nr:hypothetical protein [Lentisphaerota bacterium]
MSVRSLIIGIVCAAIMSAWCYFNDAVVRPGAMISSLLPSVAYGGLIAYVLLINPLLRRLHSRLALSGREVAAVLALFLIACGIPGWSLGQMFSPTVMFPHHDLRTNPAWRSHDVVSLAPKQMLCDVSGPNGDVGLNGFVTGLGEGDTHINFFRDVPWDVWYRTFLFWGPLVLCFLVAVIGLGAVFHRQWCDHEQLPYPIIQFASSLLPDEQGRLASIFRDRLFLVGFLFSFLLLFNNYLCRWFSNELIPFKLWLDFTPAIKLFPTIIKGKGAMLFSPRLIMTVIGLAYFLPSEASLSMWFGPWLYCFIAGIFATYGIELRSGKMMALTLEPFIFAGGYFAIFMIILYTGRQFYWNTLKCSLGFSSEESIPDFAVLGMRLFLGGCILFILQLQLVGLHWSISVIYTFSAIMVYAVVSRVLAETGAFEIGTYVYPCVILWGFLGASALGPRNLVIMFLVSTVLLAAPGWCVMPFFNQAMKLSDGHHIKPNKTLKWGLVVMVLAIVISIPATIYWQYDRGAQLYGWPRASSTYPFANAVDIIIKLKAQGLEKIAASRQGFGHLAAMSPSPEHLAAFAITALLTFVVAFGRLKFHWWPLHPVIFVFLGGGQGMSMSFSFGLGFLIKFLITKYGGGKMYQRCKPMMIGLIAGSLAAQFLPMVVGTIYYFIAGKTL